MDTVSEYVRVITYDLKKNWDRDFASEAEARAVLARAGSTVFNLYRRVNGVWTTEWAKAS